MRSLLRVVFGVVVFDDRGIVIVSNVCSGNVGAREEVISTRAVVDGFGLSTFGVVDRGFLAEVFDVFPVPRFDVVVGCLVTEVDALDRGARFVPPAAFFGAAVALPDLVGVEVGHRSLLLVRLRMKTVMRVKMIAISSVIGSSEWDLVIGFLNVGKVVRVNAIIFWFLRFFHLLHHCLL